MNRILTWFENWIDPFRREPDGPIPDRLWPFVQYFFSQARWPFIWFLVLGGLVGVIEASLFWFLGLMIDTLRVADPATVWSDHGWMFVGMGFVLLVVRGAIFVLSALFNEQTIVPGFFALVRWQSHRHVLRQSYQFFQNDFAGRVATKVMQSGQALGDFLINLANSLWFFVVFVITTAGMLAALDWRFLVLLVGWVVIYLSIIKLTMPEVRRRAKIQANAKSGMNGRIVDSYTNIQTVKLFAADSHEDAFAREGLLMMRRSVADLSRMVTVLRVSLTLLNSVLITAAGFLCIWLWQAQALTIGAIAVAMGLVFRINNMSGWIMFQINGLFRDMGTIQDAIETISQPHSVRDADNARDFEPVRGAIRFEGVRFHYGKDSGAIDHLDLQIRPGEKVGVVGRSGAGKTTMMNLLLRLYDVEGGRILVDEQDIAKLTQDSLRAHIGVVTQDTSLLHRSVRDNIAYGRPQVAMSEIEAAALRARADEFIVELEDALGRKGYEAHVGERGVKLSGGQRQRIALARVFLKDAPILVLDEATSALDSEVEQVIQEHLFSLMEGKTVLAIAHRLSTIASMDRLIVMDEGRIVEEGSHNELIAAGGLYASLWARQSGGFLTFEKEEEESGQAAQ